MFNIICIIICNNNNAIIIICWSTTEFFENDYFLKGFLPQYISSSYWGNDILILLCWSSSLSFLKTFSGPQIGSRFSDLIWILRGCVIYSFLCIIFKVLILLLHWIHSSDDHLKNNDQLTLIAKGGVISFWVKLGRCEILSSQDIVLRPIWKFLAAFSPTLKWKMGARVIPPETVLCTLPLTLIYISMVKLSVKTGSNDRLEVWWYIQKQY